MLQDHDWRLLRQRLGDEIKIPKQFACWAITGPKNNNEGRESRQEDKFPKDLSFEHKC